MVDIINYRGGKALVIDSLDLARMNMYPGQEFTHTLRQLVEVARTKVDYIMVISSYDRAQLPMWLRRVTMGCVKVNCYRQYLYTGLVTNELDTLLQQPDGLKEIIEKLKSPAEITTEYREMTKKALKEMSEMYDLVGADTDGVFVKEKEKDVRK